MVFPRLPSAIPVETSNWKELKQVPRKKHKMNLQVFLIK